MCTGQRHTNGTTLLYKDQTDGPPEYCIRAAAFLYIIIIVIPDTFVLVLNGGP